MSGNLVGRLSTGGIIVFIGVLLLLATTDVIEFTSVWQWIPLIFVVLGVWALVRSGFRNIVGPVMIIAIAGTFFGRNIGLIPDGAISTWWPLFIVLFGLLIMVNRSRRRQRIRLEGVGTANETVTVAVFGNDERRLRTEQFTGGEVVSVFGSAIIDLRDADVRAKPAVIEAIAIFGDSEVRVPREWDVRLETLNVFGDTTDRRPAPDEQQESGDYPHLVVTGVSLFGDIHIRD